MDPQNRSLDTREQKEALARLLQDLVNSDGWTWLKEQMTDDRNGYYSALTNELPVGEGAAKLAQAQGAVRALEKAIKLPTATLEILKKVLNSP